MRIYESRSEGRIQSPEHVLSLTLHFINLGKQSASIDGIGLFEINTNYLGDNVGSNLEYCDNISEGTRSVLGSMGRFIGRGFRVGGDKQQTEYFDALKRVVDGVDIIDLKTPIFVDATKEKVVEVEFQIGGFNSKKFNTVVMCPSFNMLDKSGKTRLAICKGYVVNVTGTRLHRYEVHSLWRLLPRGAEIQCAE